MQERRNKRTKETPSRRYALLIPSISVSFLMDIICSIYDGAVVKRKCVNMSEIAYEVWGAMRTWWLCGFNFPASQAKKKTHFAFSPLPPSQEWPQVGVRPYLHIGILQVLSNVRLNFGNLNKEDSAFEANEKIWMEEWVVWYVRSSKIQNICYPNS